MEADLRLCGYTEKTRVAYVNRVRAVARHFRWSPAALGEDEVRAYPLTEGQRAGRRAGHTGGRPKGNTRIVRAIFPGRSREEFVALVGA